MLLFHTNDFHIYGFRPKKSYGAESAYGFAIKKRLDKQKNIWWQFHLRIHKKAKPIPGGIGCYTYEAESWKSVGIGAAVQKHRITVKRFIRLKIGLGGNKPESSHEKILKK